VSAARDDDPDGTRVLPVRGARLHCNVSGTGAVVVLVHGWALDADMWAPQSASMREHFRLIAFDRRGFGRSSGAPGIEHDVQDLRALLDTLSVSTVAVVGMSQGARVALRFAASFPERVRALVLDGPPRDGGAAGSAPIADVPIDHYRELLAHQGIEAVRHAWLHHPLMRLRTRDPHMHTLLRAIVARYPGHDLGMAAPPPAAVAPVLRELAVPALVVNGAHDTPQRRAAGAALAGSLAHATHALVPGACHLPNLDNPTAYTALLVQFLHAHASGAASRIPVVRRSSGADFFSES
jgi:3-oxoadipate enol-lactonase